MGGIVGPFFTDLPVYGHVLPERQIKWVYPSVGGSRDGGDRCE